MGLLTDIFSAKRASITDAVIQSGPYGILSTLQSKSIEPVKLAKLEAIACGEPLGSLVARIPAAVAEFSEDGPWVYPISSRTTDRLAAASPGDVAAIAATWAAIDEFRLDGWPREAVLELCQNLSTLARFARENGDELYVWICL